MAKKIENVFQRYEKKYVLDANLAKELEFRLMPFVKPDSYGIYEIANLYFDTDDYSIIRASIEKPVVYKEKLRLRCYGIPKRDDKVFLELKKKFNDVVYKRRVPIILADAEKYLTSGIKPAYADQQIINEIDWFINMYHPATKAFIAYDRAAFFSKEAKDLRITFDRNIRWRSSQLDLTKGNWGFPILDSNKVLMEVKFLETMPLWLSCLLSEMEIYGSSFSKYGTCYQEHLLAERFTTKNSLSKGRILYA